LSALAHAHRLCTEIAVVLRTKWSEAEALESSLSHLVQEEQKLRQRHEKEAASVEESVRKRIQQSSTVKSERRKWVDYCQLQKQRLEKQQFELESCRELENSLASEQRNIEQEQATSQQVTDSGIRASKASLMKLLDEVNNEFPTAGHKYQREFLLNNLSFQGAARRGPNQAFSTDFGALAHPQRDEEKDSGGYG